jgi:osmotically-inducible protein OsmY
MIHDPCPLSFVSITKKGVWMKSLSARWRCLPGVGLLAALCVTLLTQIGCVSVLVESARKVKEDRAVDDQVTDTKIGASLVSALSSKDSNLLLDVNVDVWESHVMLTGTVVDARTRQDINQLVRSDSRVKRIYDEMQTVSRDEQARRREASKSRDPAKKEGVDRFVNDFWIETKISAQLISTSSVASVNFRWRSVRNTVYLLGRARSRSELNTVLSTIRATEGVLQLKSFAEVRPLP